MTWVDVSALTIVLWGAVKGYLSGPWRMAMHLCGLAAALLTAWFLQKPFSVYLHTEWRVDELFVGLLTRNVERSLKTGPGLTVSDLHLPPLAGAVVERLAEEQPVLTVAGGSAATVIGGLLVQLAALGMMFLFAAVLINLWLRIRYCQPQNGTISEWQRLLGLLAGTLYGIVLTLVLCVALDALTILVTSPLLEGDLRNSYLFLVAETVLIRLSL